MNQEMQERLLDLLCQRAVYGLSAEEERELEKLEQEHDGDLDYRSLEMTTAAISLLGLPTDAKLPANLRSRIAAEAERFFDQLEAPAPAEETPAAESRRGRIPLLGWMGWAVAGAACVLLAINIYTTRNTGPLQAGLPTPTPNVEQPDPAKMRQKLIETAPDLVRAEFGSGNLQGVEPEGDIVWSDAQQVGYMRLHGLPVNDRSKETYQLWIFDETQDAATPIDGGTFDINSEGEVIIPVDPKLEPRNTSMFAITVEKPGGVVVSKREKLAALAKRETKPSAGA